MKNATFPSIAKFSFLSLLLPAWITQAAPRNRSRAAPRKSF
ncbi:hypothetical protein IC615_00580 [Serratia ureilytica]